MENIRQAVERARALMLSQEQRPPTDSRRSQKEFETVYNREGTFESKKQQVQLDGAFLESKRIVSHDSADPRSKSFDMLRTQVLRTMDLKEWKILGVTSPTPGCGKTVTAINLALSIARQPGRQVLLVDIDLQRPQVATCLGISCNGGGLLDVLEARTTLSDTIIGTKIGNQELMVLPAERIGSGSSEWMASPELSEMMRTIRRDYLSRIVILDMPPLLPSDDAISILPQVDCVLLLASAGISSLSDITESNRHLQSAQVVRVVLNKVRETETAYCS
jgi:protein-tyrosine kinase